MSLHEYLLNFRESINDATKAAVSFKLDEAQEIMLGIDLALGTMPYQGLKRKLMSLSKQFGEAIAQKYGPTKQDRQAYINSVMKTSAMIKNEVNQLLSQ